MTRRQNDSTNWGGVRPNSGRKPDYDEPCTQQAYYLPTRLINKLRNKAKASGTSASKMLAKLLQRMKGDQ